MKHIILSAAALTAALAGGAASAQDWQGFYVGLSASTGDASVTPPGSSFTFATGGTFAGIHAGYNHALGSNFIVGGEISYGDLSIANAVGFGIQYDSLLQARARLGYAMGDFMPYVALGMAETDIGPLGAPFSFSENGIGYGLGVEWMAATNVSVRAEYTAVKFDDFNPGFLPPGTEVQYDLLTIGASLHF
jgi:outer membrane immunogenic protein